ncbi:MAG: c-type cytochrome [Nitrospinae bacterium]|nr:c-type cytochrome [Nitrospinota bacterium]
MMKRVVLMVALVMAVGVAHADEPVAALPATMPDGAKGASVKLGLNLFQKTKQYAPANVGNGLACRNCHLGSGTVKNAAPLSGLQGVFPEYSEREKRSITLQERIDGCFQRSMNGKALDPDSKEMAALIDFIAWIADPEKKAGRGIPELAGNLTGDPKRGKALFADQCADCHGDDGQGMREEGAYTYPPLWGPESFNDGAGMSHPRYAAGFIKWNMPYGDGGSLSDQDAADIASFVISKPRPKYEKGKGK